MQIKTFGSQGNNVRNTAPTMSSETSGVSHGKEPSVESDLAEERIEARSRRRAARLAAEHRYAATQSLITWCLQAGSRNTLDMNCRAIIERQLPLQFDVYTLHGSPQFALLPPYGANAPLKFERALT